MVGGVSDLVAFFSCPELKPVYLNAAALRQLLPSSSTDAADRLSRHTLADFVGVGFAVRLENEILPHARVLGRWSGGLLLRDEWGSEHPADAVFTWHPGMNGSAGHYGLRARPSAPGESDGESGTTDRDLLHALLETLPDDVYFKDLRSRYIRVSLAMARRDGREDAGALIGKTDFDRLRPAEASQSYELEQRIIRTGEPIMDIEEHVLRPNGTECWMLSTKLPLRDRSGSVVGTCGISRDVTAQKQAEVSRQELEIQLQLSQKLESIGRLAAGIAHEINTPSQFITDNIRFLNEAFKQFSAALPSSAPGSGQTAAPQPDAEELRYLLEEIPRTCEQSLEGLGRIARIVRSLKEFSHPGSPERTPADLNRTIENVISVSRHEWKYVADTITDLSPDLPLVPCVVDAFGQAVLNLVINAAHAIEDSIKRGDARRGVITVRTRPEGDMAVVEVSDTGTGIPADVRDRVFEPFFTTKAVGRGTGQGLAIVQQIIVQKHRGRVDFLTEEGRGTTFRLWLPLVPPPSPPAEPEPPPPPAPATWPPFEPARLGWLERIAPP